MGIEQFFNSLKQVEKIQNDGIISGLKETINSNFVYIDFNSVIHNIASEIEHNINYLLYSILLYLDDNEKNPFDDDTIQIIKEYSFDINNGITIENFSNTYPADKIEFLVLSEIKKKIFYIVSKLINAEGVKILHISFDGVPQMSKIIEQKKRRYNGYVIGKLKDKILNESNVSFSELRKTFNTHKIGINRGNITTRATLMDKIIDMLKTEEFKNEIKTQNSKLEQVIISGTNIYGEGEKKIMEHIINLEKKGTYTIYSPDADVVILGLICLNQINADSNVTVLRFNQQTEEYDFVDLSILRQNIFDYVRSQVDNSIPLDSINVTNDISFIFTLFGNDFIPRIEAINPRNDIQTLMETYCLYISNNSSIIFKQYDKAYRIKYYNIKKYIDCLESQEKTLLHETYMSVSYKNYRYVKQSLGVSKLLPVLEEYANSANLFFDNIKIIIDNSKEESEENTNKKIEILASSITDKQFMKQFILFERNKNVDIDNSELYNQFYISVFKKITNAINNFKNDKIYYLGRFRFDPYDRTTIDTQFHEKNIKESLPHPKFEITDYEKNLISE